jgi:hypothetical protein
VLKPAVAQPVLVVMALEAAVAQPGVEMMVESAALFHTLSF